MRVKLRQIVTMLLTLGLVLGSLFGCGLSVDFEEYEELADGYSQEIEEDFDSQGDIDTICEDGEYTSKEEVALYIRTYGELPGNFITKREARELGWDSLKGNLWDVAPGKSIGGDKFGNYEGLLPEESGLKYYECDINYQGGYRGAERIIFSSKGDVYYTEDHYESFIQLYEGER